MLKRFRNLQKGEKLKHWGVEVSYGSTRAIKNICQFCGKEFFGETDMTCVINEEVFCDDCLADEPYLDCFVETAQNSILEVRDFAQGNTSKMKRGNLRIAEKVKREANYTCSYCEYSPLVFVGQGVQIHADHVIPFAWGGVDCEENLVSSCADCNQIASSSVFEDFKAKKEYILDVRKRKKMPCSGDEWWDYVKPVFSGNESD